ncbi:E2/UBC family protein, partial [Terriglobus sp. YAF25]|uniref:E2/UBC family protein n=1 Tax=Terriglobus sp. YAF25 TaxID=3233080 RepID=UPI003F9B106B
MPERTGIAMRLREEGISKVDSFLTSVCNARRLSLGEIGAYEGRSLIAGWEFHVQTDLVARRLRVVLDSRFPFSLPNFFLVDRPEFLTWPHIEEDGRLCLRADNKVKRPDHPAEIVGVLLGQAADFLCACENRSNEGDFRTEFYSYWNRSVEQDWNRSVEQDAVEV